MKKLSILFISLSFVAIPFVTAQNKISFGYDADGNMTSRQTVVLAKTYAASQDIEEPVEPEIGRSFLGEQQITIRPNPTHGQVILDIFPLDMDVENLFILYDSAGRMIETRRIEDGSTDIEIAGDPGLYLLNIRLGENTSQWKIVKQ